MTGPEIMLMELQSHRLDVQLVPLNPRLRGWNDGGCKRVKADENPKWYRLFCKNHPSSRVRKHRKHDTKIKRANTERALRQMIAGRAAGKYDEELRRIANQVFTHYSSLPSPHRRHTDLTGRSSVP